MRVDYMTPPPVILNFPFLLDTFFYRISLNYTPTQLVFW